MKIVLLTIGKTDDAYIQEGIDKYCKRLTHYLPFELQVIPDIKNRKKLSKDQQKDKEGELILSKLLNSDTVVLLDEKGKTYSSVKFSAQINQYMLSGCKRLVFVIGGPYGFSPQVYQKVPQKLSLSAMTFSHQMVRLFMVEQIYRAMTILKNEPYHHE
jgi:23S rRNA (pseudouridine1915-N3)-methyltransferase